MCSLHTSEMCGTHTTLSEGITAPVVYSYTYICTEYVYCVAKPVLKCMVCMYTSFPCDHSMTCAVYVRICWLAFLYDHHLLQVIVWSFISGAVFCHIQTPPIKSSSMSCELVVWCMDATTGAPFSSLMYPDCYIVGPCYKMGIWWNLSEMVTVLGSHLSETANLPGPNT